MALRWPDRFKDHVPGLRTLEDAAIKTKIGRNAPASLTVSSLLHRRKYFSEGRTSIAFRRQQDGELPMPNARDRSERELEVQRLRMLKEEITDPLATRLLEEIVSEMEADLKRTSDIEGS